jgi:hypothetical protein
MRSTQPREYNRGATWKKKQRFRSRMPTIRPLGIRHADNGAHYLQKLALTSPTRGGRSVGIVRSRTQTTEFFFLFLNPSCAIFPSVPWSACICRFLLLASRYSGATMSRHGQHRRTHKFLPWSYCLRGLLLYEWNRLAPFLPKACSCTAIGGGVRTRKRARSDEGSKGQSLSKRSGSLMIPIWTETARLMARHKSQ